MRRRTFNKVLAEIFRGEKVEFLSTFRAVFGFVQSQITINRGQRDIFVFKMADRDESIVATIRGELSEKYLRLYSLRIRPRIRQV